LDRVYLCLWLDLGGEGAATLPQKMGGVSFVFLVDVHPSLDDSTTPLLSCNINQRHEVNHTTLQRYYAS
jgi:hypothetical protein